MDRAFRILTIYNRLLQNKSVNKQSLTLELDTSPRSIQRDIDDIRNFLYESKSWISAPKEITYDYKSESYKLGQVKHENMHFMYDILTALYLTTPKLSHYFYQYLKLLILKHHSDNRTTLLKYLDHFEIDKNQTGISPASLVVQAMNENKYLQYNQKLLLPLSLYYQMNAFHLVYRMNDEIHIDDINQMNLSLSEKPVDTHKKSNDSDIDYEMIEAAVSGYMYRLEPFYNYDEYPDILQEVQENSPAYEKLVANKESGNFADHSTYDVDINLSSIMENGMVLVDASRLYSHVNSNGQRISRVHYIVDPETNKIIDFEQISDAAY
ncbi:hypothetical protein W284_02222 [Staphylococcus aureus DAR3163]|uniref:transcriptional regulator n=1 Tax=Staphylococcus TaxID=1279 RepID=UPI00044C601B|nr:transcriptional regulator [Staphylococcus aureus]EYQ98652.1 hypothetical protein W284_02222 [Staphylococcus aureus DAR3163]